MAITHVLGIAANTGLIKVLADTTPDNIASQRTLVRTGFSLVGSDAALHHYEAFLDDGQGEIRATARG